MEIITDQIKKEITKEITRETLENCIEKIDKEIEQDFMVHAVSPFYINGLIRTKNIIREIALDCFGIVLKIKSK